MKISGSRYFLTFLFVLFVCLFFSSVPSMAQETLDVAGHKRLEYVLDLLNERRYQEADIELKELEFSYPKHPKVVEMRAFSQELQESPDETTKMALLMDRTEKMMDEFNQAVEELGEVVEEAKESLAEFGTAEEIEMGNAVLDGNYDRLKELLEQGANPNGVDFLGSPVIASAVSGGRLDMVKLLLDFGADPESETVLGETVLELAEKEAQFEIVDELMRRGASFEYAKLDQQEKAEVREELQESIPYRRNFIYENYVQGVQINGPSHWFGAAQMYAEDGAPVYKTFPNEAVAIYRKNAGMDIGKDKYEPMFEIRFRSPGDRELLDHMKVYEYVADEQDFLFKPQLVKVNGREWAITSYRLQKKKGVQTISYIRKIAMTTYQDAILHLKLTVQASEDDFDGKIMKNAIKSAQFF